MIPLELLSYLPPNSQHTGLRENLLPLLPRYHDRSARLQPWNLDAERMWARAGRAALCDESAENRCESANGVTCECQLGRTLDPLQCKHGGG
jgi:hypothetical protein